MEIGESDGMEIRGAMVAPQAGSRRAATGARESKSQTETTILCMQVSRTLNPRKGTTHVQRNDVDSRCHPLRVGRIRFAVLQVLASLSEPALHEFTKSLA